MHERKEKYDILAVVGPTACGKTSLAVDLALAVGGELFQCVPLPPLLPIPC